MALILHPLILFPKDDTKSLITRTGYIWSYRLDCVQRNFNNHSIMRISYMHFATAALDKFPFLNFSIKYLNTI